MLDFIRDIASYQFLQNALIASLLTGVTCAIIGTYIVVRRMVFLSGGITHASFGGIGIAYYFGFNPIIGALIFSVLSSLGMDYIASKTKMREDSAIGVLWALGMAIGIIFIFMTPGYTPNLMSFLFGNILTITDDILLGNAVIALLLIAIFTFFNRQIIFPAFAKDFAKTQNIPVALINGTMLVLTATTIVLTIKLVGIVLLVSLLTIPPITVNTFTHSYNKITLYAIVITCLGSITGLYISYISDLPSGASIIIVLGTFYILSRLIFSIRKHYR